MQCFAHNIEFELKAIHAHDLNWKALFLEFHVHRLSWAADDTWGLKERICFELLHQA